MYWFRTHALAIAPALSSLSTMALSPVLAHLLAPESGMMLVSLCSSDGVEQTIAVPLGDDEEAPMDHCKIACHAACSRKGEGKAGLKPKA